MAGNVDEAWGDRGYGPILEQESAVTATYARRATRATDAWVRGRANGVWFFMLAAFALPLALYQLAANGFHADITVVVLQELIVVYASFHLSTFSASGRRHPMQLGFWLFVYVWMGLAGLLQEAAGTNPFLFFQNSSDRSTAAVIVLTGLVAYDVGLALASTRAKQSTGIGDRAISMSRTRLIAIVGLVLLPLIVPKLGGLAALFSSRQAVTDSLIAEGLSSASSKAAVGIYTALGTVPVFLALLILVRNRSHRTVDKLLLALVVAANVVINNPISNARFWFGTICFAALYTSPRLRRNAMWRWLPAVLLVILIVGFPYADRFRYSVQGTTYGVIDAFTISGDYDASAQMVNAVAYVSALGHTNGHQIEGAVLFWLPRSVWPDKANDTGTLIGQYINFQNLNLSCPLWAEAYIDFGWLGVILLLGLLGYFSRRADGAFERQLDHPMGPTLANILVPILAGYEFQVLRGSLLEAMGQLVTILIVAFCLSRRPLGTAGRGAGETNTTSTIHGLPQPSQGAGGERLNRPGNAGDSGAS